MKANKGNVRKTRALVVLGTGNSEHTCNSCIEEKLNDETLCTYMLLVNSLSHLDKEVGCLHDSHHQQDFLHACPLVFSPIHLPFFFFSHEPNLDTEEIVLACAEWANVCRWFMLKSYSKNKYRKKNNQPDK